MTKSLFIRDQLIQKPRYVYDLWSEYKRSARLWLETEYPEFGKYIGPVGPLGYAWRTLTKIVGTYQSFRTLIFVIKKLGLIREVRREPTPARRWFRATYYTYVPYPELPDHTRRLLERIARDLGITPEAAFELVWSNPMKWYQLYVLGYPAYGRRYPGRV